MRSKLSVIVDTPVTVVIDRDPLNSFGWTLRESGLVVHIIAGDSVHIRVNRKGVWTAVIGGPSTRVLTDVTGITRVLVHEAVAPGDTIHGAAGVDDADGTLMTVPHVGPGHETNGGGHDTAGIGHADDADELPEAVESAVVGNTVVEDDAQPPIESVITATRRRVIADATAAGGTSTHVVPGDASTRELAESSSSSTVETTAGAEPTAVAEPTATDEWTAAAEETSGPERNAVTEATTGAEPSPGTDATAEVEPTAETEATASPLTTATDESNEDDGSTGAPELRTHPGPDADEDQRSADETIFYTRDRRLSTGATTRTLARSSAAFSVTIIDDAEARTVALSGPVVVGRAPDPKAALIRGNAAQAGIIIVRAGGSTVSQSHVRLTPVVGAVLVRDLWSTNGTRVTSPTMAPFRLRNGEELPVGPGSIIDLGDGVRLTVVSEAVHGG